VNVAVERRVLLPSCGGTPADREVVVPPLPRSVSPMPPLNVPPFEMAGNAAGAGAANVSVDEFMARIMSSEE